jgi:hypothetical protein
MKIWITLAAMLTVAGVTANKGSAEPIVFQPDYSMSVPLPAQKPMERLDSGMPCQTKLTGFIGTDPVKKKADLWASKTPEAVSIRVDRAAHRFYLTTATAVESGITNSGFFSIISETNRYIVAMDTSGPGAESVLFDKSNSTFVWTKAVQGLGLSASAIYLECR